MSKSKKKKMHSHLVQVDPRGVVTQFEGVMEKYPNLKKYVDNFSKMYWPEFEF